MGRTGAQGPHAIRPQPGIHPSFCNNGTSRLRSTCGCASPNLSRSCRSSAVVAHGLLALGSARGPKCSGVRRGRGLCHQRRARRTARHSLAGPTPRTGQPLARGCRRHLGHHGTTVIPDPVRPLDIGIDGALTATRRVHGAGHATRLPQRAACVPALRPHTAPRAARPWSHGRYLPPCAGHAPPLASGCAVSH